jgi:hypothetical protein
MAKPLTVTKQGDKFHVEGYPDAIAVKRIDDPIARQLQATSLHHVDLSFCRAALAQIADLDRAAQPLLAEALWVSSIARYFKCFGQNKAPTQLPERKILKGQIEAAKVFAYFRDLRDKHIIHDENPYSQGFAAVALNSRDAKFKVADILSLEVNAFTVDDDHLGSFSRLVDFTFGWVDSKRDELLRLLGAKDEQWEYDKLLALPDVAYTAPTATQVSVKR